jgi:hypothetical protein
MPPRGTDFVLFFYITLFFSIQISILGLKLGMDEVKKNWALNRCNPIYMPLADDIEQNFSYCIQTSVTNLSPFLLEPFNKLIHSIAGVGESNMFSINALRVSNSNFRNLLGFNFSGLVDSIGNLGISFQKNAIVIKDTVGKVSAIILSIVYIIKTTMATFQSTWEGPPGQVVKGLANTGKKFAMCFHPTTYITLHNGCTKQFQYCQVGDVLIDGSMVLEKFMFYNLMGETFFEFDKNIFVTSYHKVFSEEQQSFVHVYEHEDAKKTDLQSRWLITFVTSSHLIPIRQWLFMDWEDD